MFTKCEILPNEPKLARVISAHNMSANLLFYPVAHGFERSLLSVWDQQPGTGAGVPFFAKGMNFAERAFWIGIKMLPGYHCLSIDVSSFDNCIREGFFHGELDVFTTLDPLLDRSMFEMAFISSSQDTYSPGECVHTLGQYRKSGDLHTGSGNCAVMHYYCTNLRRKIPELGFFCDGDDTLIFCPQDSVGYCKSQIAQVASQMGLEVRVDHHAQSLSDIEFC